MQTTSTNKIAILMATYNGEKYVAEQIDSILKQDYKGLHLFIHDNESTDGTKVILDTYAERYPDTITVLRYCEKKGALENFMSLLTRVDAPYYMFADQDDRWHCEKVGISYKAIIEIERQHKGIAILVHSDAVVTDKDLNVLHPSYREYGHLHPEEVTCLDEFVYNIALGCTMIFNKAAAKAALSVGWDKAIMHDGWLTARVFAENGIVHAIPQALLDYRQTGANTIGALDGSKFTLRYRIKNFLPMIKENIAHYKMLHSAGYPSILKYYYYKLRKHVNHV